ncbi:hypothetical protein, partial [Salmonella enterica]|uniref:hypothetical protein n=1 Tax=Salmonella enterica TaxID=28901 RepID=UPI00195A62CE
FSFNLNLTKRTMRLPTSYGSYGYFQASPGGKSREKHNFTFCSIILTTSALVKKKQAQFFVPV